MAKPVSPEFASISHTHPPETFIDRYKSMQERKEWFKDHDLTYYDVGEEMTIEEPPVGAGEMSPKFQQKLDALRQECLTSSIWAAMVDQIRNAIKNQPIDKIVVLCLGSLYYEYTLHESWCREMAFVLAIQELVRQEEFTSPNTKPVLLVFQDPELTLPDFRLLTTLGGTVVDHPVALNGIDSHSLVLAKCPPFPLLFYGILQKQPAVLISTAMESALEIILPQQARGVGDFDASVDVKAIADNFMVGRKSCALEKVLLTSGCIACNYVPLMAVYWLHQAGKVFEKDVVGARDVGKLGSKAEKWLKSL